MIGSRRVWSDSLPVVHCSCRRIYLPRRYPRGNRRPVLFTEKTLAIRCRLLLRNRSCPYFWRRHRHRGGCVRVRWHERVRRAYRGNRPTPLHRRVQRQPVDPSCSQGRSVSEPPPLSRGNTPDAPYAPINQDRSRARWPRRLPGCQNAIRFRCIPAPRSSSLRTPSIASQPAAARWTSSHFIQIVTWASPTTIIRWSTVRSSMA